MKKIIILILLTIFLSVLSGCGFYNLSNFTLPDDLEFLEVVKELDSPQKIGDYMKARLDIHYVGIRVKNLDKSSSFTLNF